MRAKADPSTPAPGGGPASGRRTGGTGTDPGAPTGAPAEGGTGGAGTRRGRAAQIAALVWSAGYAVFGAYWWATGDAFPYAHMEPGQPGTALVVQTGTAGAAVLLAGLPGVLLAAALLYGPRAARPLLIGAGGALAAVLMLAMTDVNMLASVGYIPFGVYGLVTGHEIGGVFLDAIVQWPLLHGMLCAIGGLLWLRAVVGYARRTGDGCRDCGRGPASEGWLSPGATARWGRAAALVAAAIPVVYAVTRFAWVLGIPLGVSEEFIRDGQGQGMLLSGAFLAGFGVVGAVLTLGLFQKWGEVFPRWMVGLAGRRVPVLLAVIPASFVSVLVTVGGIGMSTGFGSLVAGKGADWGAVGPSLLWPLWGVALAAATLAYYHRRLPACAACDRP